MLKHYTYERYKALYHALDGITTHFVPTVGVGQWSKPFLTVDEFTTKLNRLIEIENQDDDWLFENHPDDYIDYAESESWEVLDLRSELFVIELERCEKVMERPQ